MPEYKVVNSFTDTMDKRKKYNVGDVYPKGEYKPTKERIEELSSVHPEHKRIFIETLEDKDPEGAEKKEKEKIKAELESLGVTFHPNTGLEKLKEKLEEAKAEQEDKE
ncbi:hypothetical protein LS684_21060 (plasmid) [Cytobacillus spongiae]|uniref:hypothetical protein n=1 Tax=Cytobacillus spongiae TaxID=2901381 RepID=UPI001F1F56E0|nr:hypothetical protein [Cytobacillus spongiae]UII58115.1 hypothetical protein LS684_21060 [Cytobacillus spongiae]